MEDYQTISQLRDKEKKQELKKQLEHLKELIQEENNKLYDLFLKANDNLIKTIDYFLKNQITKGQFEKIQESRNKRNKKVFECLKEKTKND